MKKKQKKYSDTTPSDSTKESGLTEEELWLKEGFLGAMRVFEKEPTQEEALKWLESYEGMTPSWVEELPE